MRILILGFLLLSQSFLACQQDTEKALTSEASLRLQFPVACRQEPAKARTPATNIIFQSTDGGQTWQDVSAGLPVGFSPGRVIAGNGEVFLCSEKEMYFSNTSSEIPEWADTIDDELFALVEDGRLDDARDRVRVALGLKEVTS